MDPNLRRAWTEIVTPEDYDRHMTNNGQTPANAEILKETLQHWALKEGAELLIVGAGTCHFMEFPVAQDLRKLKLTLTDINCGFLEYAIPRLANAQIVNASLVQDDIEQSTLTQKFDGVVAVLVLEHVDWEVGLRQIVGLATERLLIVIQKNADASQPMLTAHMPVPETMQVFGNEAPPKPVDQDLLRGALADYGFEVEHVNAKTVAIGKQMIGLCCRRS